MEQFIRDDGIIHPHAAFVENTEDGLLSPELQAELPAQLLIGFRQIRKRKILDVALVVGEGALGEPSPQAVFEQVVRKVPAPQSAIFDTGLGQRAVEVEHAHQPRPGAAPVGHRQNGAAMGVQAGQHVVAVLPDRFGHDERSLGGEVAEHFHAHFL